MKKVIVLSTVLGLSALGMACGEAASNNANTNKPAINANTTNVAPVSTPASTPAATNVNTNSAAPNSNVKPSGNTTATPAGNANAKPTPKA